MADFWIKVEKSTPDKPEIFELAEILNLDPDAVLGKLIRAWSWLDSNSDNGHIKSVTNVLIDRVTGVTGFAESMKSVGWLEDGTVPNFDRHMGESAKKRAKDAERKRKSRVKSETGHVKSVTESGLEERRGEEIKESNQESKIPPCPHSEIINLYHNVLPELPKVLESRWSGSAREKDLRARWKEDSRHQDLAFWNALFNAVRSSAFHMGTNDRGWQADLGWMLKRANFDKMLNILVGGA